MSDASMVELRPSFRYSFFLLVFVFLGQWLLLFSASVPEWDAAYYYAYARSLAFDQDVALENDLLVAYPFVGPHYQASRLDRIEEQRTVTGQVDAPFAVGTGLLWAGWLWLLRQLSPLLLENASPTGYEWPFILTIATFSALCGLAAFWLGYRLACQIGGEKVALAAAITLMFSTPLLYYQFRDPIYSHTASALTTGLVVYAWWWSRSRPQSWRTGVWLGGLVGLASLVRWQHVMYLALPAVSALWDWAALSVMQRRPAFRSLISYGVGLGAAAFLVFLVQMAVWKFYYGSWVAIPQGENFMVWTAPFWQPTLFSTYRGLFLWMPVALFSLFGLIALVRHQPRLYLPLLLVLCLEIYVNSSTRDWFGGGGFGPRRFTSELLILIIGYAGWLRWLVSGVMRPRWLAKVVMVVSGLLFAWQQWTLLRYGLAQKLGGRNLSMQPDFRWEEVPFMTFVEQIVMYGANLWQHPGEFLLLPRSPLFIWQQTGVFPWTMVGVLVGMGLVAAAFWQLYRYLQKRWRGVIGD